MGETVRRSSKPNILDSESKGKGLPLHEQKSFRELQPGSPIQVGSWGEPETPNPFAYNSPINCYEALKMFISTGILLPVARIIICLFCFILIWLFAFIATICRTRENPGKTSSRLLESQFYYYCLFLSLFFTPKRKGGRKEGENEKKIGDERRKIHTVILNKWSSKIHQNSSKMIGLLWSLFTLLAPENSTFNNSYGSIESRETPKSLQNNQDNPQLPLPAWRRSWGGGTRAFN